ncbi:MAG: efflux RND transporter periplasmic adaptor subunit [Rhodothermales bacterium]|nr:efflux RND transporter periplasmic adaptor subunit [Rhodothermales bacterium]
MRIITSIFLFSSLLMVSIVQTGCNSDAQSKETEEPEEVASVPVEATRVSTGDISAFFTGTASLEAENEAVVVAKAGGIVEQIFVEEGSYVERGAALAKLDDERLLLDLARDRSMLQKAERELSRQKEFFDKQLISTEEYERFRTDYETQKAAYDLAELSVAYTTVRAPISGVISMRHIKVGNMVQTNQETFNITDFSPLLAVLHVPERELNKLKVGQEATLTVDAMPGESFTGRIKRISPVVDRATGTFKVTVEIRAHRNKLKPGMFGRVGIVYDTRNDVLLIPKEAVVAEDDNQNVFLVTDSLALRTPVTTGYSDERFVEIITGARAGDLIITTGQNNLRDSSIVEVINSPGSPIADNQ